METISRTRSFKKRPTAQTVQARSSHNELKLHPSTRFAGSGENRATSRWRNDKNTFWKSCHTSRIFPEQENWILHRRSSIAEDGGVAACGHFSSGDIVGLVPPSQLSSPHLLSHSAPTCFSVNNDGCCTVNASHPATTTVIKQQYRRPSTRLPQTHK